MAECAGRVGDGEKCTALGLSIWDRCGISSDDFMIDACILVFSGICQCVYIDLQYKQTDRPFFGGGNSCALQRSRFHPAYLCKAASPL